MGGGGACGYLRRAVVPVENGGLEKVLRNQVRFARLINFRDRRALCPSEDKRPVNV